VGLGDDYSEDLMTALAEASHANYYYVKDAEKLPGVFRDELGTVKSAVARNVKITITLRDGVGAKCVLGEPRPQRAPTGRWSRCGNSQGLTYTFPHLGGEIMNAGEAARIQQIAWQQYQAGLAALH